MHQCFFRKNRSPPVDPFREQDGHLLSLLNYHFMLNHTLTPSSALLTLQTIETLQKRLSLMTRENEALVDRNQYLHSLLGNDADEFILVPMSTHEGLPRPHTSQTPEEKEEKEEKEESTTTGLP
jgi:hypothetical protein